MKKLILPVLLFGNFLGAQLFIGRLDKKVQVGVNLQNKAKGIVLSYDKGMGSNFSLGIVAGYLIDVKEWSGKKADFVDRFNIQGRANANIAEVFGIEDIVDLYPGLNINLKNFGAHFGIRYFLTKGFGVYSEFQLPIVHYDNHITDVENYNNQFNFSIGTSFYLD
ncbi:MAG: DUF6646 family protein [Flavobacteriales bacterium]